MWCWECSSAVEHLPWMHKILGSVSSATTKNKQQKETKLREPNQNEQRAHELMVTFITTRVQSWQNGAWFTNRAGNETISDWQTSHYCRTFGRWIFLVGPQMLLTIVLAGLWGKVSLSPPDLACSLSPSVFQEHQLPVLVSKHLSSLPVRCLDSDGGTRQCQTIPGVSFKL